MLFYFTILKHHFINIPYHFTIPSHPKTLFLLKYYFLTHSLLFLSNRSVSFSWAFKQPFLFLSPLAPVQHTTHTHDTLINLSKPITTPPHTQTQTSNQQQSHTQTQPSNKAKPHTQTQTHSKTGPPIKTQARPPIHAVDQPIHAVDQPIHAADLKPRPPIKNRSKPIQKNHHRSKPIQTHSKNIITEATGANPFKKFIIRANPFKPIQIKSLPEQTHSNLFKKTSSPEPPEQTHPIKSSPKPSEQIHSKK